VAWLLPEDRSTCAADRPDLCGLRIHSYEQRRTRSLEMIDWLYRIDGVDEPKEY